MKYYWVIQVSGGNYYTTRFKSYEAAYNRFSKVRGGEVYLHESFQEDERSVIDEFKASQVRR